MNRPTSLTPAIDPERLDHLFDIKGMRVFLPGGYGAIGEAIASAVAHHGAQGVIAGPSADTAEALVLGDSQDAATILGPLTLASGRDKVERLIAEALEKGARLVSGGKRPEGRNTGFFLEPTVLADVPDTAAIMAEEPFGPVAPVATFRDFDAAIARAKSTPYGLAAYVFTGSHAKAEALSKGLHAGMVGVNTFMAAHAEAPFGGIDHSGMGREGGREAIRDGQNTKLTDRMAV